MAVTFPYTKRYWVTFRHADTGLTPTFTIHRLASTLTNLTPLPTIVELLLGVYYFDVTFTTAAYPDIVYQIDGGASIPTDAERYRNGVYGPKDVFLDQPVSSIPAATWDDNAFHAAGTKGFRVANIGDATDSSGGITLFAKVKEARELVRGDDQDDFNGVDIKTLSDNIVSPITTMQTLLTRALGLMHENSVLDQTAFDGDNNLTVGRFRIYSSKANALAAGATGLLGTYTISASYTGGNLNTYTMVKEP